MAVNKSKIYAVLLAGGTGTRLWPVSRRQFPKQLVKFAGDESLIQNTARRLMPVIDPGNLRVVCGEEHSNEIARDLQEIGIDPAGKVIQEPAGRNTAPAILLAALLILRSEPDAVLGVFPADHIIGNVEHFHDAFGTAVAIADQGYLAAFGIKPIYPETGYGYIEGGESIADGVVQLRRFVEKPDVETAKRYIRSGNFYWNSGMFVFKASAIIDEFSMHAGGLLADLKRILTENGIPTKAAYESLVDISIDYAIMEKTGKGALVPTDFSWSDIGSWKELYDFLPKDINQNVISGDVVSKDTQNSLIIAQDRLVTTNRLKNMVVVETTDAVFVSDLENSRDVKQIVEDLKKKERQEFYVHQLRRHSWGSEKILVQGDFHVRWMKIDPQTSFKLDSKAHAIIHLTVVRGQAMIAEGEKENVLSKGETMDIATWGGPLITNRGHAVLEVILVEC